MGRMGPMRTWVYTAPYVPCVPSNNFIDHKASVKERSIARVQFMRKFFQLSDAAHKEKLLRA